LSDIFREVDEEVRKDRLTALWKKYGYLVIAAAVAVVLGTAASVGWREYQASVRDEEAAAFAAAMDKLNAPEGGNGALGDLAALAADGDTGYALLARLQEAGAQIKAGDRAAAVATYDAIAEDGDHAALYRDLARLLAAMALLDDGPATAVQGRINALKGADNPWRYNARELDALLAVREGRRDDAVNGLQGLADDTEAPPAIRGRARQMLTVLGVPAE
jgi:hypothetical protein